MTASLQTYARKHMEAIDGLSFEFEILLTPPDEIVESPEDGVIVFGLYLEGARRDSFFFEFIGRITYITYTLTYAPSLSTSFHLTSITQVRPRTLASG